MIREFKISDLDNLKVQPKQAHYTDHIKALANAGALVDVVTYVEYGEVKAVIGAQPYWKGRVAVWSMLGDIKNWTACFRQVKASLDNYAKINNVLRFEITTEDDFIESERWTKMLGFKYESTMQKFGVDGLDHKMWVMICQQQ